MKRPSRPQILIASAVLALLAAAPMWSPGTAGPAGTAAMRMVDATGPASPLPANPVAASPSPSDAPPSTSSPKPPTQPPQPPCRGCVSPQDTICWELVMSCPVPLTLSAPLPTKVTLLYQTFAVTAKPNLDYVEVRNGTVVIPAGKLSGVVPMRLLSNPYLVDGVTFGIELVGLPDGVLGRSQAVVTIRKG